MGLTEQAHRIRIQVKRNGDSSKHQNKEVYINKQQNHHYKTVIEPMHR